MQLQVAYMQNILATNDRNTHIPHLNCVILFDAGTTNQIRSVIVAHGLRPIPNSGSDFTFTYKYIFLLDFLVLLLYI